VLLVGRHLTDPGPAILSAGARGPGACRLRYHADKVTRSSAYLRPRFRRCQPLPVPSQHVALASRRSRSLAPHVAVPEQKSSTQIWPSWNSVTA
jgi:hypothetical protein